MQTYPVARLRQPFHPVFMGRPARPVIRQPNLGLTRDEALSKKNTLLYTMAAEMLKSAGVVAANLDKVYNDFTSMGTTSWLRSITAMTILPMFGQLVDAWNQSTNAQKARIVLKASLNLAQKWINSVSEKFLPVFLDEIEYLDPGLASKINDAFDLVTQRFRRNTDLMVEISELPAVVMGDAERAFFPAMWKAVNDIQKLFSEMTLALHELLKALGETAKAAAGASQKAPYFIIAGVGLIAIWLLLR